MRFKLAQCDPFHDTYTQLSRSHRIAYFNNESLFKSTSALHPAISSAHRLVFALNPVYPRVPEVTWQYIVANGDANAALARYQIIWPSSKLNAPFHDLLDDLH